MSYLLIATLLAEFCQPHPGSETRMTPAARQFEPEPLSALKILRSLVLLVWICATIDLKTSLRQTEIPF
jgi:hypothetical protein